MTLRSHHLRHKLFNTKDLRKEMRQAVNQKRGSLFLELENDPDFRRIAERWGQLSDELKEAVLGLVR